MDPDRSSIQLNTVDQGCSAQIREVASCGAQSVSRSRSRVTESGPAWSVASTNSEGKSRGVPTYSKTTRSSARSRPRCFRRFERSGGHDVARIIEVRMSCSSGSAVGCSTRTMRAIRHSCSEMVGCIGRGTSQIGVRVGRRSSTSAAVASRNCSEAPVNEPYGTSASTRLGSGAPTIAVTCESVAGREDSVGSKAFGGGVAGPPVGCFATREGFSRCRKRVSGTRHHHGRGSKFRSNGSSHRRRRDETTQDGSRPHHNMMMFVVRGARCGLRGVRVGEASHPGPPLRRLRSVLHASRSWC